MISRPVLGVIPARGGSKSILNKNLLKIHNVTLTKYALFSAIHNTKISHIALSSDSNEILSEIEEFNGHEYIRIKRPIELSSDTSPDQPVLEHALKYSENLLRIEFATIVMLQPTSPIRSQEDIDLCINNVINSDADSSWTMSEVPIKFHYKKQFIIDNGLLSIATDQGHVPRRQDLKNTYYRDGVCYAYKRETVLTDTLLMGKKCIPVISKMRSNDIDNFEDYQYLENLTFNKYNQLFWKE
jgi:CMP-N,N'-diacetyllegionaminic acid synthase